MSNDWSSPTKRIPKALDKGFLLKKHVLQLGNLKTSRNTVNGIVRACIKRIGNEPEMEDWWKEATLKTNSNGEEYFEVNMTSVLERKLKLFKLRVEQGKAAPISYSNKVLSMVCCL